MLLSHKLHSQKVQVIIVIGLFGWNIDGCFSTTFFSTLGSQVTMQRQLLSMGCVSTDCCRILLTPPFQDRSRCSGATNPMKGQHTMVKLHAIIIGRMEAMYLIASIHAGIQSVQECLHRKYSGGLPFVSKQMNSSEGLSCTAHATSRGSAYIQSMMSLS